MREIKSEINGLSHHFELLIEKSELDAKIVEKLAETKKRVKMPGFRPGHVPLEIIAKNYGFVAKREAIVELMKTAINKLLAERKLKPALQPEANVVSDNEEGLKISVNFEIIPEIDLVDFKNLKIKKYKVKIPNEEIENFLKKAIENNPNWKEAERNYVSKKGDKVTADIELLSKKNKKNSIRDVEVVLKDGEFVEDFWNNLVGLKVDDEKEFSVHSGDKNFYKVKVTKICKPERFKLDDEFAKFVGLESAEKINDWAADMLRKDYMPEVTDLIKKQLLEVLTKMYSFDIPGVMVDLEEKEVMRQIELEASKEGKKLSEKKMPKIKEECRDIASRRVRLGLVIAKIAVQNKIVVSSEEIKQALYSISRLYPGRESEIVNQYIKDANMISAIAGPLLEEKVIDFILKNYAEVSEVEVTKEEFNELDNDYFDCYDDESQPKGVSKRSVEQDTFKTDLEDLKDETQKTPSEKKVGNVKEKKSSELKKNKPSTEKAKKEGTEKTKKKMTKNKEEK